MKSKFREKEKAIELRKKGYSYNEIKKLVPVTKSTLSMWLCNLPLTNNEKEYLKTRKDKLITRGRIKAAAVNVSNRKKREQEVYLREKKVFSNVCSDPMFLLGVAFYWAEGSNKTPQFQFMNSDPAMIKFMYAWTQKYLGILKKEIGVRIFMQKVYSQEETENYWCDLLNIEKDELKKTVFKKSRHYVKHNVNYMGCVRLEVSKVEKYRTVMAWKDCLKTHILRP